MYQNQNCYIRVVDFALAITGGTYLQFTAEHCADMHPEHEDHYNDARYEIIPQALILSINGTTHSSQGR